MRKLLEKINEKIKNKKDRTRIKLMVGITLYVVVPAVLEIIGCLTSSVNLIAFAFALPVFSQYFGEGWFIYHYLPERRKHEEIEDYDTEIVLDFYIQKYFQFCCLPFAGMALFGIFITIYDYYLLK